MVIVTAGLRSGGSDASWVFQFVSFPFKYFLSYTQRGKKKTRQTVISPDSVVVHTIVCFKMTHFLPCTLTSPLCREKLTTLLRLSEIFFAREIVAQNVRC